VIFCIGDGDSSVSKRLKQIMPYGPKFFIEKIECRNHLLRNLGQKITGLIKNTKYPIHLRTFINNQVKLNKFRSAITMAVQYRNSINDSNTDKIKGYLDLFCITLS